MEQKYLIDTNSVIDNFGNKLPSMAKELLYSCVPIISAVTKIELLGWTNATTEQLNPLYAFIKITNVLPIDQAVVEKTILIRQKSKIDLGDAIIAATALVHNLTLITHNTADFKNIADLKMIDPHSL
jgi:predicted nucleic acid-binding protein